jgi:CRP/FNR family transcriptional regulator, cyclic AMP receptor protein
MSNQILVETLSAIRFLRGVSRLHLEELAKIAQIEECEEGEMLFAEGDAVKNVYLLIHGEVALDISASGIRPQHVLTIGAGDSLGWSALLGRRRRMATAKVTEATRVVRIDGNELLELCQVNPRLGFEIMRQTAAGLADRLNAMCLQFLGVYRLQPAGFTCGAEEIGVD